jgi:hypothetical protein
VIVARLGLLLARVSIPEFAGDVGVTRRGRPLIEALYSPYAVARLMLYTPILFVPGVKIAGWRGPLPVLQRVREMTSPTDGVGMPSERSTIAAVEGSSHASLMGRPHPESRQNLAQPGKAGKGGKRIESAVGARPLP